ncbi:MAG: phage baseplate assembly protein V [Planctomycetota bacterium]
MESITDILSQGRDRESQASKIHGFVVGLVTNNKDPDKLGRIKVKFPWLSDDVESWWARVVQPMGGKERGQWWIPEIDDEVLVGFEQGDVRFPYVLGSLYNGKDLPPKCDDITSTFGGTGYDHGGYSCSGRDFNEDGKDDLRFIRSRSGHLLIMDDKSGDERITICDKTGKHRLEIHTKDKRVVITSEDGDIELIAEKKILLRCEELVTESRKDTSMTADQKFTVLSKSDMSHESKTKMARKAGTTVEEKAGTSITYKSGTDCTVQSGTNMTVKAGVNLTAQASAMGELKAGANLTIKGAVVMIN